MFNKIYRFLKINTMSPSTKQICRLWLAKDLRQYRMEYRTIISHMIGNNWVLGNKTIDTEHLFLKKFSRILFIFIFILYILYLLL